jgi:hypothetical protein
MRPSPATIFSALLALLVVSPSMWAQQAPLNSEVTITKIEPSLIESPKIPSGAYTKRTQGRPGSWLEVEVTFDRNVIPKAPKFADELTFNYYILLKNEHATEDKKPTLLTGSVTHVHVPQEKGLHSVVYVSPRALSRFFDGKPPGIALQTVLDVGVEISGKDGLLAISTSKGTVKGDKGWWTSGLYTPTPGVVLNKNETPFAPLEWDYYEAIKSKSGN